MCYPLRQSPALVPSLLRRMGIFDFCGKIFQSEIKKQPQGDRQDTQPYLSVLPQDLAPCLTQVAELHRACSLCYS